MKNLISMSSYQKILAIVCIILIVLNVKDYLGNFQNFESMILSCSVISCAFLFMVIDYYRKRRF